MRAITPAQQAVLTAGVQAEHYRLSIKDPTAVWRDLTSYAGFNAVESFSLKEKIEDPHRTLDVVLKRELNKLSFAPGISSSPLNRAFSSTGAVNPLIALNREVKLELAITPMDRQPTASDWMELFRGKIDSYDPAKGYGLEFGCRASPSGRLAQQFIKTERVYSFAKDGTPAKAVSCRIWDTQISVTAGEYLVPATRGDDDPGLNKFLKCSQTGITGLTEPVWTTGANQADGTAKWDYVGAPTTTGNPLEQILQNILDDAKGVGDSAVTLFTPTSPLWDIREFLQQRQYTLDALLALVQQIGWDIRPKWRESTGQFELTMYQPDRGTETVSPTVLYTFAPRDYGDIETLAVDISRIRNNLTIRYPDRADLWPDGSPKRKERTFKNQASIDKYGDLWSEIQEDEMSQLDSATEVDRLGASFISDCCEPTAQMAVPLKRCFPWVEANDFYRFSANNLHTDTDLKLAVTGWSLDCQDGKLQHKLELRGLPTIGARVHLAKTVHPAIPPKAGGHRLQHFQGPKTTSLNFYDSVGGAKIQLDLSKDKHALLGEYEVHVYPTPGTGLDDTTLLGVTKSQELSAPHLIGGGTYYARSVPRWFNAGKLVRGQPSKEVSFVAGRARAGHIHEGIALGAYPLNGGFETRSDPAGMPDHWSLLLGTFGSDALVKEDGNGLSGGRYLRLQPSAGTGLAAAHSAQIPIINERADGSTRYPGLYRATAWMKNATSNNAANNLEIFCRGFDYTGSIVGVVATVIVNAASKTGHWQRVEWMIDLSGSADYRSVDLGFDVSYVTGQHIVDIDEVRLEYVGTPWYAVGDTTKFTDNYESIPAFSGAGGGWSNFGAPHETAAFRRNAQGRVFIKGLVASGTHTTGTGNKVFVLPVGFRPPANGLIHYATAGNSKFAMLEIDTNGNVYAGAADSATYGSFFSLACSFETSF